ncbi:MAG: 4-hydroxythreonine-4-phosphate dehydrogenase PdxA [Candidatus Zapsychrus exili]|nr:4-hydroxythreonine-4-phosphate dehydrogenase PdxA [Candidatus Zapsychrus exili]
MKLSKKNIGITLGDPAGIGPEIVAKALSIPSIRKLGSFTIIGDEKVYSKYCKKSYKNCSFVDTESILPKQFKIGVGTKTTGKASLDYLKKAVELIKQNKISSLVTAPICKEAVCKIDKNFIGHTEFLANTFKVKKFGMLFVSDKLNIIVVTRHIPLKKVSSSLTINKVYDAIDLTHQALTKFFRIKNPIIAICGLNPHAGEGGKIGTEEQTIIIPAMKKALREAEIQTQGPFAADTLFSPDTGNKYDVVVAMYHDQGLIAAKTMCFAELVNMTVGLGFVRTSPAHGTAFNIAGKNKADCSSICKAIKLAAKLS